MPNLEPVLAQQDQIRIRHIGPAAAVWPGAPVDLQQFTVLNCSSMVARPLPISDVPGTPDFVSGYWTGRLDDAGENELVFPNSTSSDGLPWRQRFDPTGHLQFLEVYFNGEVDSVCVIDQTTPAQGSVTVHGDDGWWLLKKAYVRDWTVTQAPRDVIERGTKLWLPTVVDDFPPGALNSQWSTTTGGGGTIIVGPSGGVSLALTNTTGNANAQFGDTVTVGSTATWTSTCAFQASAVGTSASFSLSVKESSGDAYTIQILNNLAYFSSPTTQTIVPVGSATSQGFSLESDGEWVSGFINGQMIGCARRNSAATTSLDTAMVLDGTGPSTVVITGVLTESLQPFLMRGTDKGDYVLPGDQTTYPSGGLSARYFTDTDLAGLTSAAAYLATVLNPSRTQAFGTTSPAEYADQQDAQISGQDNPSTAPQSNWSCVWFGAIYLKLSAGNYSFEIAEPGTTGVGANPGVAVRAWIGKTQFGAQLVDEWTLQSAGVFSFTLSASSLAGALPYSAGTVNRDGWYPIKIEYACGTAPTAAPVFYFTPPTSYTDPGGTALASGSKIVVPSTSLSPLGMMDQRYQGIAHFDLVQQTLQATGLHASVEPKQLESGLFPGVLAPRIREGHDTDVILSGDRDERADGEGLLNYSSTLDSTDFASSLQGNGAGVQNGSTGQLQAVVYDPATMTSALFDAQGWQDNSDASLPALLQALLNSQLALSLEPWQSLSADPSSRPRRAFTWPLTGAIQSMRWRPGDGVFVRELSINVFDAEPRQMLVITRNIGPDGIQSSNATFANRPRNPGRALKRQLFSATRQQRNYQRQLVTLTGIYIDLADTNAVGANTPNSMVSLSPGDTVVDAVVRVAYNLNSSYAQSTQSFNLAVNGTDVTSDVGGPWITAPISIPITAAAVPDAHNRLYAYLTAGGSALNYFSYQLLVTVLR